MAGKFAQLKVAAKTKAGRGSADAQAVIEALKDSWDDLAEAIKNMSGTDQESLKDHFNKFDSENDDLGDILFGSYDDFESRMTMLDTEAQNAYTNELKSQEVIDL